METPFNVMVEHRKPIRGGGHMVKVHFLDLGMFIDGWRVTHSDKHSSGWWFQPPARKDERTNKFISTVENDKNHPFWLWLEAEAVRVVEEVEQGKQAEAVVKDGQDEMFDAPDEVLNDDAAFNQYMSDELDQAMLDMGIEPKPAQSKDPWRHT